MEANPDYWDRSRPPRVKRIVFDNTLSQIEALELLKRGEGRVDVVFGLSPLETARVSQSSGATVVKQRQSAITVFGQFNLKRPGSPWTDVRLRRAANLAINRPDLIRYGTNGNGVVIPGVIPPAAVAYDPDLAPYAFDPGRARQLVQDAGHADGLAISLIAPPALGVQATVVGKMLEAAGFRVDRQVLTDDAYNRKVNRMFLDRPAEQQTWDIALAAWGTVPQFPIFGVYEHWAVGGMTVWGLEPMVRPRYEALVRSVDPKRQKSLLRQLERWAWEEALFLFLYSPIELWAVGRSVTYAPHTDQGFLNLHEIRIADGHWSLRPGAQKP